MTSRLLFVLLVACSGERVESPATIDAQRGVGVVAEGEATAVPPTGGVTRDQAQQHPPLPADNPVWDWDAGGFVPDYGWYGEPGWDEVRMRVAGHVSVAARDLARVQAEQGDHAAAAQTYTELAELLEAIDLPEQGVSAEIGRLLREAARRDAALCAALHQGTAPPVPEGEGLAALRARLLVQAQKVDQGGTADATALTELQEALRPIVDDPHPDLAIDAFEDFDSRHELRVKLFEAWLDSLDPLGLDERWGYWRAVERRRQALALFESARELGGTAERDDAWYGEDGVALAPPPEMDVVAEVRRPSATAARLRSPDQQPDFTVEGLGRLPTGDTLIDVAAEPGPLAIGSLEKLGLEDPDHHAWLKERARMMDEALLDDAGAVLPILEAMVAELDAHGHGSRYYNIKQARNEVVRQLAREGSPDVARTVLRMHYPLHNQDWACPNRVGILEALEGRLLAEAGDTEAAVAMLQQSLASARVFLDQVDQAERLGPQAPGNRPPAIGGGQGGQPAGGIQPPPKGQKARPGGGVMPPSGGPPTPLPPGTPPPKRGG